MKKFENYLIENGYVSPPEKENLLLEQQMQKFLIFVMSLNCGISLVF